MNPITTPLNVGDVTVVWKPKPCDACGEPVGSRDESTTVLLNVPDSRGRKRLYGAYGHTACKERLEARVRIYVTQKRGVRIFQS